MFYHTKRNLTSAEYTMYVSWAPSTLERINKTPYPRASLEDYVFSYTHPGAATSLYISIHDSFLLTHMSIHLLSNLPIHPPPTLPCIHTWIYPFILHLDSYKPTNLSNHSSTYPSSQPASLPIHTTPSTHIHFSTYWLICPHTHLSIHLLPIHAPSCPCIWPHVFIPRIFTKCIHDSATMLSAENTMVRETEIFPDLKDLTIQGESSADKFKIVSEAIATKESPRNYENM